MPALTETLKFPLPPLYSPSSVNRIFRSLNLTNLNPFVQENIRRTVFTCLRDCLRYSRPVNQMFYILLTSIIFKSVKIFTYFIFKYFIGIVLFSLGIFWNDSLSGFTVLKKFSNFIIGFVESYFSFNFPRTGVNATSNYITSNLKLEPEVQIDPKNYSYIPTTLGLILLGSVGLILGVVLLDNSYPEIFDNIPVVHTASEQIINAFDLIYSTIKNRILPTPPTTNNLAVAANGQGVILPNDVVLPNLHVDNFPNVNYPVDAVEGGHFIIPNNLVENILLFDYIRSNFSYVWNRFFQGVLDDDSSTLVGSVATSVTNSTVNSPTIAHITPPTHVDVIPTLQINGINIDELDFNPFT